MRVAIGSLLFLAAPALAAAQAGTGQGLGAIRADMVLHRISVLAHDSMAGRDTPSPELEQAASWIAAELERFGVRGGAEGGGFVQRFPLVWRRLAATESTLQIEGEAALSFGTDVVWLGGGLPSGQVRGRSLVIQPGTDAILLRRRYVVRSSSCGRAPRRSRRCSRSCRSSSTRSFVISLLRSSSLQTSRTAHGAGTTPSRDVWRWPHRGWTLRLLQSCSGVPRHSHPCRTASKSVSRSRAKQLNAPTRRT